MDALIPPHCLKGLPNSPVVDEFHLSLHLRLDSVHRMANERIRASVQNASEGSQGHFSLPVGSLEVMSHN